MKHRRPPLPHWSKGKGFCRWCGEVVLKPDGTQSKRQWHDPCVDAYKIAAWPAEARKAVWERDKGVCGVCCRNISQCVIEDMTDADLRKRAGLFRWEQKTWKTIPTEGPLPNPESLLSGIRPNNGHYWQADHIIPLIEADRADLSYWSLSNLRILCTKCHKAETKALAGRRAQDRKESIQPTLL